MKNNKNKALDFFKANSYLLQILGESTKQEIIIILGENKKGLSVEEIAAQSLISRPTISHHLKILKQANLVIMKKDGNKNIYKLTIKETIKKVKEFIKYIEVVEKGGNYE